MSRRNLLTQAEMYKLCKHIESVNEPFLDWSHAIKAMKLKMEREVTRANLDAAIRMTNFSVDKFIKISESSSPVMNMMAQVRELQRRVTDLENLISSDKDFKTWAAERQ